VLKAKNSNQVSGEARGLVLRRSRRISHWSEWHWTAV